MAINNPVNNKNNFVIDDTKDYVESFADTNFYLNSTNNQKLVTVPKGRLFDNSSFTEDKNYYFIVRPKNATSFSIRGTKFSAINAGEYLRVYYAEPGYEDEVLNNITIDSNGVLTNANTTQIGSLTGQPSQPAPDIDAGGITNLIFTWRSFFLNAPPFILPSGYFDLTWTSNGIFSNVVPNIYTIDGPLSLKGTNQLYTLAASKTKGR